MNYCSKVLVALLIAVMILVSAVQSTGNTTLTNSTNSTAQQLIHNQLIVSYQQFILAILAIAACLICIWLVFIFGRSLHISASLRSNLVQGLANQQTNAAYSELIEKAILGELGPITEGKPECWTFPIAMVYDPLFPYSIASYFEMPKDETPEQKKERENNIKLCQDWAEKERARFEKIKSEKAKEIKENAEKSVPESMDISLLGGGFSFLLEFSAIIVIIFTLLTLGILKVLDGKDITTILASIAGYVLGKAQAGASAKKEEKPTEIKPGGQ